MVPKEKKILKKNQVKFEGENLGEIFMSNFIGSKSDKKMYRKFDEIYYNDS